MVSEKWNYKKLPLELKKVHDVLIHIAKFITPKTQILRNQSQNKLLVKKKSLADQVILMQSQQAKKTRQSIAKDEDKENVQSN